MSEHEESQQPQRSDDRRSDDRRSDDRRSDDRRSDDRRSDDRRSDDRRSDDRRSDDRRSDDRRSDDRRADGRRAEDRRLAESRSEESRSDEQSSSEGRPEDGQSGDGRSESRRSGQRRSRGRRSSRPAGDQPAEKQGEQSSETKRDSEGDSGGSRESSSRSREPRGRSQGQRPNRRGRQSHGRDSISKPRTIRSQGSISVVIPLLNEAESLPELSRQLEDVLQRFAPDKWNVLFIDDGSTDSSFDEIQKIHVRNHRFSAIRFRRNYGKSAALGVGFAEVEGDIVITMDADLQDDPNEIPALITKLEQGFDLVSGWKRKRHDPWHKTIPSKLFNVVTSIMSGVKLHDFNCGLKAYRREVIKTVQVYGEMHRYIPALAHWDGFRVTEIPVQHHERKFGVSKFGMSRFLKGFLDLLTVMFTTRFVKRPLHFFGAVGALFAVIGFVTDAWLAVEWFLGMTSLSNRPLALFGVAMIIVGVQLISIGLIGELIVKQSLQHERYSIKERLP